MPLKTALKGMKSHCVMRATSLRQRGLAYAGRSPQDERTEFVALDLLAQRLAGPEDVLLPDDNRPGARAACAPPRGGSDRSPPAGRTPAESIRLKQAHCDSPMRCLLAS